MEMTHRLAMELGVEALKNLAARSEFLKGEEQLIVGVNQYGPKEMLEATTKLQKKMDTMG